MELKRQDKGRGVGGLLHRQQETSNERETWSGSGEDENTTNVVSRSQSNVQESDKPQQRSTARIVKMWYIQETENRVFARKRRCCMYTESPLSSRRVARG